MADTQTPDDISKVIPINPQYQVPNAVQNQMQIPNQIPQIQQPPQQTYVVYAPQMYQPRPQYNLNQVQPIQYPQFQHPQRLVPPQQQPYLPYQQQPQMMQPLIPPLKQEETLKHDSLRLAGKLERRFFNLQVLSFFLLFQAFALVLCCSSYRNGFIEFQYNLYGSFKVPFYIFTVIMALSLLYSYTASKKLKNSSTSKILCAVYGISYGFFIQALYSSTYSYYYYYQSGNSYHFLESNGGDEIVIIVFSFINLEVLSLFTYAMQELDQLSFRNSFWYVMVPSVTYGGILFSLYYQYGVLCGIICFSIAFGFYLQFILSRMIQSTKFNLRSDDGKYAAVLLGFLILVPFFDIGLNKSDEMVQESQSQNNQQKNNIQ
ncbi:unnamed protein product (macronuclear) [Paramecium tetraurelia]|uniref:Transmembrane protein n=1 Tax=Paramecium tetraurelia TaxID=5888 RepID=A0BZY0_PARTE|nr:uncharacterized protein GSPATT00005949001 [Paramecium tetraurelia]CAK64097.1 unnamed protein product [Paramecium tetraurelia]|eukprot:XP_001431495.1 hypothetical protein (macronuclear) [Paramecium tetraurelia strain d4-2]